MSDRLIKVTSRILSIQNAASVSSLILEILCRRNGQDELQSAQADHSTVVLSTLIGYYALVWCKHEGQNHDCLST